MNPAKWHRTPEGGLLMIVDSVPSARGLISVTNVLTGETGNASSAWLESLDTVMPVDLFQPGDQYDVPEVGRVEILIELGHDTVLVVEVGQDGQIAGNKAHLPRAQLATALAV